MTEKKRKYRVGCLCHAWCPNTTLVDHCGKSARLWMCPQCTAGMCPHAVHTDYIRPPKKKPVSP